MTSTLFAWMASGKLLLTKQTFCQRSLPLCAALAACAISASAPLPVPLLPPLFAAPQGVQAGDWVFRSGIGGDSAVIRRVGGGRYSHVGIVVQGAPHVLVAHATPDDEPRYPKQVVVSAWDTFASRSHAHAVAIARPRFLDASQRAASARAAAARVGQAFDLRPVADLAAPPPLYCTTLLLDAVRAQAPAFAPAWQRVNAPMLGGHYLLPQTLAAQDLQWLTRSE